MTKLPAMAVRNAIAFVDAYGNFPSNSHVGTRIEAGRYGVEFNADYRVEGFARLRFYSVTDAGRELADKGTLAACLRFCKERGFAIQDRRSGRAPTPRYIPIRNRETGVEGFISGGRRVYLPAEGTRFKHEVAFEASLRNRKA